MERRERYNSILFKKCRIQSNTLYESEILSSLPPLNSPPILSDSGGLQNCITFSSAQSIHTVSSPLLLFFPFCFQLEYFIIATLSFVQVIILQQRDKHKCEGKHP